METEHRWCHSIPPPPPPPPTSALPFTAQGRHDAAGVRPTASVTSSLSLTHTEITQHSFDIAASARNEFFFIYLFIFCYKVTLRPLQAPHENML